MNVVIFTKRNLMLLFLKLSNDAIIFLKEMHAALIYIK